MSSLTLLGTGTCQIEHERRASSVLLNLDQTYLLFDCGHGIVQRLLDVGVRHNQINHIVFSHFHPDHIADIVPLMQAGAASRQDPRTSDLHIYGPIGVKKLMNHLFQAFGLHCFQKPAYQIIVHEVTKDDLTIAGYDFEFLSLPPAGNHGLRFQWHGRTYALTGDSHFHPEEIAFLKNVDLAVIDSGHLEDAEIIDLAVASQTRTIVCSHLYREIDIPHLQAEAAKRGYQGTILMGRDLLTFVL